MKAKLLPSKKLKYLFWLGPCLCLMGLTAAAVSGSFGNIQLGLVIAGLVIIGLWLLYELYVQQGFWQRRSTQASTNALIGIVAFLAILGLINFLAFRYPNRIDLTENQIYSLSSQSQIVAQSLKQPVKAWLFTPETPDTQDKALLDNYRKLTPQFSYEYVDPDGRPAIAQRLGVKALGEVYLESGSVRRLVQTISAQQQQRLSERKLTNGLVQVTNPRSQRVYFLEGHGERSLEAGQNGMAQSLTRLGEENYTTEPLNLSRNLKVPDDAAVLVIAGAERPLLEKETAAIKDYLQRQSGLLLMIDPNADPKLNQMLDDWGVQLSDRIIFDPIGQQFQLGAGVAIVNQYGDHPITKEFGGGISFFPLARPIATKPVNNLQATPILFTNEQAQAKGVDPTSGESTFNPATDPKPPYTIGVALSRSVKQSSATNPNPQARLVVIGNSTFATNGLFEQQLNGDIFLNAISWLSQRDDEILAIRPKEVANRRIVLSLQQRISMALMALGLLPTLGFGMAAIVWWRRR